MPAVFEHFSFVFTPLIKAGRQNVDNIRSILTYDPHTQRGNSLRNIGSHRTHLVTEILGSRQRDSNKDDQ